MEEAPSLLLMTQVPPKDSLEGYKMDDNTPTIKDKNENAQLMDTFFNEHDHGL